MSNLKRQYEHLFESFEKSKKYISPEDIIKLLKKKMSTVIATDKRYLLVTYDPSDEEKIEKIKNKLQEKGLGVRFVGINQILISWS